jgi:hypothetical protein
MQGAGSLIRPNAAGTKKTIANYRESAHVAAVSVKHDDFVRRYASLLA